jgi:ribosomal protein S18 acetylase RimI-like enzyme
VSDERWARWRASALDVVSSLPGDDACLVVVEHPVRPGKLAACGAGVVNRRLPNPFHPHDLVGYVQWMSTDPAFRRQGMARAVLRAVLAWFSQRGVDNVELHATAEGEPLYRSECFWQGSGGLPMRRRPWDPPPDAVS